MNNSMVAHLWANEKQESANGSNFYFEGESIYSYGRHFEVGRIARNKRGEKAYLINDTYYSSTTSKHQYYVREAIPTGSKVFYVECNISYCIGNMLFVTNMLESIKDAIEKYKKAKAELSYRDIWGTFKNLMDYIEFFDMGTPKSLLKKSANEWLGTNHELSRKSDKIKREHARELKRIFQILLNHQALEVLGTVNVIVDEVCGEGTWLKYWERAERHRVNIETKQEKKRRAREEELDKFRKDFYERLEKWKSGELNFLHSYYFIDIADVNAWMRIKEGIIETSKQIKIGIEEARRMWQVVSLLHRGGQFRHGLVEDENGKWRDGTSRLDALNTQPFGFSVYAKPFLKRVIEYGNGETKVEYDRLSTEKGTYTHWLNCVVSISYNRHKPVMEVECNECTSKLFVDMIKSICNISEQVKSFINPEQIKAIAESNEPILLLSNN